MKESEQHNRLLSTTYWVLIASWLLTPFMAVLDSAIGYFGNGLIAILALIAIAMSIIGLLKKQTRTSWFVISLALAILTFLYGIMDFRFPHQT